MAILSRPLGGFLSIFDRNRFITDLFLRTFNRNDLRLVGSMNEKLKFILLS
jgi:hypothetical protein